MTDWLTRHQEVTFLLISLAMMTAGYFLIFAHRAGLVLLGGGFVVLMLTLFELGLSQKDKHRKTICDRCKHTFEERDDLGR